MTLSLTRVKDFFANRTVRLVLVLLLALVLVLICFGVFGREESTAYQPTAEEARLGYLLEQIDGVDRATVTIAEEGQSAVGAVVIFTGKDGLLTRMRIAELSAEILRIPQSAVRIYPSQGK